MSVELEKYQDVLDELGDHASEVLRAAIKMYSKTSATVISMIFSSNPVAAARIGINTYCLSLDPGADQYVSRIFGAKNYMVVDHVERLPEKLPMLYMGLTR